MIDRTGLYPVTVLNISKAELLPSPTPAYSSATTSQNTRRPIFLTALEFPKAAQWNSSNSPARCAT